MTAALYTALAITGALVWIIILYLVIPAAHNKLTDIPAYLWVWESIIFPYHFLKLKRIVRTNKVGSKAILKHFDWEKRDWWNRRICKRYLEKKLNPQ